MAEKDEKERVPLEYSARRETVPLYRKMLAGALLLAGLVGMVLGVVVMEGPARANLLTAGVGLAVWGCVIWFQSVR